MDIEPAIESWQEYYEMSDEQVCLLRSIYNRKVLNSTQIIFLTKTELSVIESKDEEGMNESRLSFQEIGIEWLE